MKEELHHLLDGEMTDGQAAELLGALAEDGENRSLFCQQMRLHEELARNGGHDTMSSAEDAEMLGRLRQAIGITGMPATPPPATGRFTRGALALIGAACLVVGGGLGYLAGDRDAPPVTATPPPASYQPPAAPTPPPIDRDSLMTALRDSITQAMAVEKPASPVTPKKRVERSRRRTAPSFDDPTGAAAARSLAKRHGKTK